MLIKNLKQGFNVLWECGFAVENAKQNVLDQMKILYRENTPEFVCL